MYVFIYLDSVMLHSGKPGNPEQTSSCIGSKLNAPFNPHEFKCNSVHSAWCNFLFFLKPINTHTLQWTHINGLAADEPRTRACVGGRLAPFGSAASPRTPGTVSPAPMGGVERPPVCNVLNVCACALVDLIETENVMFYSGALLIEPALANQAREAITNQSRESK